MAVTVDTSVTSASDPARRRRPEVRKVSRLQHRFWILKSASTHVLLRFLQAARVRFLQAAQVRLLQAARVRFFRVRFLQSGFDSCSPPEIEPWRAAGCPGRTRSVSAGGRLGRLRSLRQPHGAAAAAFGSGDRGARSGGGFFRTGERRRLFKPLVL
jgi:hypothetical protein